MAGPHLDDVELLSRLVAFDTTSHESNLPFLDFLEDYLDRPGIRRERGLRLLPGADAAEMTARVDAAVREAIGDADWLLETVGLSPPMESSADSDLYRALQAEVGDSTDEGVAFATDAGWLERLGHACVIFGPGSIEVAHRPNEWVDAEELARAGKILDRQIGRWCGATG